VPYELRGCHAGTVSSSCRGFSVCAGAKICYVTDVVFSNANLERIAKLADEANMLFIESPFLDEDADHAARKHHLTARQAGLIARAARVHALTTFHFSPRYAGLEAKLRAEAERAFRDGG
jgi:ribonuclease Z